jgi:predicted nuclease of predicted toxin-antitoxin system
MKVLLDTCVSGMLRQPLLEAGHDVIWTGDWQEDPGDDQILAYAYREGRVLVTLDKDFGALAVLHRQPHMGIVRLVNLSTAEQIVVCRQVLAQYESELSSRAIITADKYRVRIRQSD